MVNQHDVREYNAPSGALTESLYGEDGNVIFWRAYQKGNDFNHFTQITMPLVKVKELIATMEA